MTGFEWIELNVVELYLPIADIRLDFKSDFSTLVFDMLDKFVIACLNASYTLMCNILGVWNFKHMNM